MHYIIISVHLAIFRAALYRLRQHMHLRSDNVMAGRKTKKGKRKGGRKKTWRIWHESGRQHTAGHRKRSAFISHLYSFMLLLSLVFSSSLSAIVRFFVCHHVAGPFCQPDFLLFSPCVVFEKTWRFVSLFCQLFRPSLSPNRCVRAILLYL
jgi:hypothetical protein